MRAGFLLIVVATGCVAKKQHELVVADLSGLIEQQTLATDRCEAENEGLRAELSSTHSSLEAANGQLAVKVAEAGQLQQDVVTMQAALAEMNRQKALADQSMKQFRELVAKFQAMIDAGTLKVKVLGGRMVVELATDILFPAGSASLSKEGTAAIGDVAKVLASIPGREFQVAGHTDDRPIGTAQFPSNWHLGSARAIAVVDVLNKAGLGSERVSAASFAEYQPADTNRTPEGRSANRRIEIIVVPDLTGMPGYADLAKLGQPMPQ